MDVKEARALLAEASDDEPAVLPRSVPPKLSVDDLPAEAAFQIGTLKDGVINLEWEAIFVAKGDTSSLMPST